MTKTEFKIQAALSAIRHWSRGSRDLADYVKELACRMEEAGVEFEDEEDDQ